MYRVAYGLYWALNHGTMGRDKKAGELAFAKILPSTEPEAKPARVTAAQKRAGEVAKWRKVLSIIAEAPGLMEDEGAVKARALERLAVLKAKPPKE
jgi:hypothetical protein